jgi:predicted Holliday junction resolvase-like endonuclease
MKELITILTILVLVMSALIIYKQKIIINELGRQLEQTQSLYKELFDLYKKTEKLWKHK